MPRHGPSVETPYGWVIVFASLAVHSISLGAPTMLFVALKPIAEDLETARAVPSFAYSLLMIGAGAGGILMGLWMDRRGVLQPVLFGSVMIGLGALLASYAEDRWSLFIATGVLIGLLGKSAMIAPLVANVTRWFDRRRGLAVAIITSGQGLAGAIWPAIVQYSNDLVGWRGTFLYFSVLVAVTMVPLSFLLAPRAPISATDRPTGIPTDNRRALESAAERRAGHAVARRRRLLLGDVGSHRAPGQPRDRPGIHRRAGCESACPSCSWRRS